MMERPTLSEADRENPLLAAQIEEEEWLNKEQDEAADTSFPFFLSDQI
ncbi:hypothetical protein [Effusibacillus consociatus]